MMKNKLTVHSLLILGAAFSLALLSGCSTAAPTIASHPDAGVDYTRYQTFMMLKPSGLGTVRNAAATPTLVRQVRQETEAAFAAKGLTKSDTSADMLVLIHGGVAEKLEVQDTGLGYGRFGRGFVNQQELSKHKEGALFIDVFDAKTRELIWRGSATAEIGDTPTPEQVKAAVDSIVARFPN
jgi:hypothetical protein